MIYIHSINFIAKKTSLVRTGQIYRNVPEISDFWNLQTIANQSALVNTTRVTFRTQLNS